MNLDPLVNKIEHTVATHTLAKGQYARWLWQNASCSRDLGTNEYGCADAANILYTIGHFPQDTDERRCWVQTMQLMQGEDGLFHESTHHEMHTTAHVIAALELFDAQPLNRLSAYDQFLSKEGLYAKLDSLDWLHKPWPQSHQGAGLYAAMVITRSVDLKWQNWYFDYLREHCDPHTGMSRAGSMDGAPLYEHLCGWFHYLFNHVYAKRPFPYPERLIDNCIRMYDEKQLGPHFGEMVGFKEIDWVFSLNRAIRQTAYRSEEARERLADFGDHFIAYLNRLDAEHDDEFNDLHMLFGAVCALAELQQALPGRYVTTVPLKIVLDRRPFI